MGALLLLCGGGRFSGQGFDASNPSRHGAFAFNAERTNGAGGGNVDAPTQFLRRAKLDHADRVAVLLPKQHHGARRLSICDGHVAVLLAGVVGPNPALDQGLNAFELFVGHFLEVREVEAQAVGLHERSLLLHVRAEHLAQGFVEKVRGAVVAGA